MSRKNFNYQTSKELILKRLKRDIQCHEQGSFNKMGEPYDDFDEKFPRGCPDLMLAWTFWDAWIDEARRNFAGLYPEITKDKWPKLARLIVDSLEKNVPIKDPVILSNFDLSEKPGFWDKMKDLLGFRKTPSGTWN